MTKRRRKTKSTSDKRSSDGPPTEDGSSGGGSGEPQETVQDSSHTSGDSKDDVSSKSPSGQRTGLGAGLRPGLGFGGARSLSELPSLARIVSISVLILGIIAVGALFYKVMAGFFVPLFLAALLVVIFRPIHHWFVLRLKGRRRMAALATTGTILMSVLLPILLLLSVAATQFTVMVSHVDFADLTSALDRLREQVGVALPRADEFRRLDELADSLDEPDGADVELSNEAIGERVAEALALVQFLQSEVDGPAEADVAAADAETKLQEFAAAVERRGTEAGADAVGQAATEEQFHRLSLSASAAIRTWMRTLLGGSFYSQARLIANPSAEDFKSLLVRGREFLQPRFVSVTSATGSFVLQSVIGLVVLVIAVYFFLIDGPAMTHTLMRLSPLDDAYEERLLMEFDRTSRAVVLASVLSALAQGVLAAVAFWFLGFDSVILLFLLTSVMALVPFLGAASVWVPCALYLAFVDERLGAAIFLGIYGASVVSSIDNVIKMFVLHGRSALHPLLALLSVLGGVKVFGPIGILVGPMVVVFLQTLLEILNHELSERDAQEA